jgi:hypothetical protein
MARAKAVGRRTPALHGGDGDPNAAFKLLDIIDGLSGETRRCLGRAFEQAVLLADIANEAIETAGQSSAASPADELVRRAHRMQGIAAHALSVLQGLEREAGRLEGLASIKQVIEPDNPGYPGGHIA